jgi:dipeptidyl aminopeptidase/acylaminoacyl peptidase
MKISIKAPFIVGCVALFSSAPSFANKPAPTSFVRVTTSKPAYGIRPSLSADGTVLLYTTFSEFSEVGGAYKQSVHMDKIALDPAYKKAPSVLDAYHIEFPSGAPDGVDVWTSTTPSMNSNGAIVATTPVYREQDGSEFRDHLRIFKVANSTPELLFQKSGKDIDSVNSVRVSRNGAFVAYSTVDYDNGDVKTTVWTYNVMSKSEKAAWSSTSEALGVKGISDDGNRILLSDASESETGGGNISVLNVATGAKRMLTNVTDLSGGPCSSSWDGVGSMTAFAASAPLVKGDTNRALDVYLASTANPKALFRISVAGGRQGNFSSGQPEISRNGLYTTFVTRADNLRAGDSNYAKDLYVYSLNKGALVSYVNGDEDINSPTVSSNGRVVAFTSASSNLVPGDDNKEVDLFVGYPSSLP